MFLLVILPWIITTFKPKPKPKPSGGAPGKPTRAHLRREIVFDLFLSRLSMAIDIVANVFVVLTPMPALGHTRGRVSTMDQRSQGLFVLATTMGSLGSGSVPAMQSLALCILQVRALDGEGEQGVGELFGALAVLQAVGQMILGPMIFGLIYSGTVAGFPKGIFATSIGLVVGSLVLMLLVRGPGKGKRKARERGRSRVKKDLRV